MKKNIIICLFLIILFIPNRVKAENLTPSVDTNLKIYDYADLLADYEEQQLLRSINKFIATYNMDFVVVTIDENPYGVSDYYTEEYAQDFYDYNDFGLGTTKDGLIVLIDMDNRYPYIVTTGHAILVYDDERISKMHDNSYQYLKDGDYYYAIVNYVDSATNYAEDGIPDSNRDYCIDESGDYYYCEHKSVNLGWSLLLAVLGSIIPLKIHLGKYKGINVATNANTYMKDTNITKNVDQFLTTFTSRTVRIHDSGSGGSSGHSGGSSISHGSSGSSHGGGGGRHF